MPVDTLISNMLPAVEVELRSSLAAVDRPGYEELYTMMAYHLGWEGEGAGPEAQGKRIRPLLVLLTTASAGAAWELALPAAAAVELIHNFSLIHDDIEDGSQLRRGRPTIWSRWGVAQAINTGDTMFTLAHLAAYRLADTISPEIALAAGRILHETCLRLTQGQYLDISYEARDEISDDDYWSMVAGKTAELLAACTEIGALVARVVPERRTAYRQFGQALGLAFQAQDDWLGIWGDEVITGKSTASDLISGKKSLPVIFGLRQRGEFARLWSQGPISPDEVIHAAKLLDQEGAQEFTQARAEAYTRQALAALESANPVGEAAGVLKALSLKLLNRNG